MSEACSILVWPVATGTRDVLAGEGLDVAKIIVSQQYGRGTGPELGRVLARIEEILALVVVRVQTGAQPRRQGCSWDPGRAFICDRRKAPASSNGSGRSGLPRRAVHTARVSSGELR